MRALNIFPSATLIMLWIGIVKLMEGQPFALMFQFCAIRVNDWQVHQNLTGIKTYSTYTMNLNLCALLNEHDTVVCLGNNDFTSIGQVETRKEPP